MSRLGLSHRTRPAPVFLHPARYPDLGDRKWVRGILQRPTKLRSQAPSRLRTDAARSLRLAHPRLFQPHLSTRSEISGADPARSGSAEVSQRERALKTIVAAEQDAGLSAGGALRFFFPSGSAKVFARSVDIDPQLWQVTFGAEPKNFEYYRLIEETIKTGFAFRYLVLFDLSERAIALQPLIIVDQDLAATINGRLGGVISSIRARAPRFLYSRMLIDGCLVGEGKLGLCPAVDPAFASRLLAEALRQFARSEAISLIAFKDFSS